MAHKWDKTTQPARPRLTKACWGLNCAGFNGKNRWEEAHLYLVVRKEDNKIQASHHRLHLQPVRKNTPEKEN